MKTTKFYRVELTDTFAGEPNYCWKRDFKIKAKSIRGAILKLSKTTGLSFRFDYDSGDIARYNDNNSCVCVFVELFDDDYHGQLSVLSL